MRGLSVVHFLKVGGIWILPDYGVSAGLLFNQMLFSLESVFQRSAESFLIVRLPFTSTSQIDP